MGSKAPHHQLSEDEMMDLSPWDFDQSPKGWRSTRKAVMKKEDWLNIADLIRRYLVKNKAKIEQQLRNPDESIVPISIFHFHIGQLLAFNGKESYQQSIEEFNQSFHEKDDPWNSYVAATIGFLTANSAAIDQSIQEIENWTGDPVLKMGGNIEIVKVLKNALENGETDYQKVYTRPR